MKKRPAKRVDELGTREEDSLGVDARVVLRAFAGNIITGCFNRELLVFLSFFIISSFDRLLNSRQHSSLDFLKISNLSGQR